MAYILIAKFKSTWCVSLSQILATVLERGEPTEVLSLAVTAAQCMKEVAVDKKVVELKHPGKKEDKLTKTVSQSLRTSVMFSRFGAPRWLCLLLVYTYQSKYVGLGI